MRCYRLLFTIVVVVAAAAISFSARQSTDANVRVWDLSSEEKQTKPSFRDVSNSKDTRIVFGDYAYGGTTVLSLVKLDAPPVANRMEIGERERGGGIDRERGKDGTGETEAHEVRRFMACFARSQKPSLALVSSPAVIPPASVFESCRSAAAVTAAGGIAPSGQAETVVIESRSRQTPTPPPPPPSLSTNAYLQNQTMFSSARSRDHVAPDGSGVSFLRRQRQAALPHAQGPRGHSRRPPRGARVLRRDAVVPPPHPST